MLVKRNERAIRNYRKDGRLQAGTMLIFRQMPNCQECEGQTEKIIITGIIKPTRMSVSSSTSQTSESDQGPSSPEEVRLG